MKNLLVLITAIIGSTSFAQWSLQSDYNVTYIGNMQSATVHYAWNKAELYGGLSYRINRSNYSNDGSFFKRTAYATDAQHIGGLIGFKYKFLELNQFTLFGFFESRHSFAEVVSEYQLSVGNTNYYGEEELALVNRETRFGPYWFAENNIGLGYQISIIKGLYLNSKAGFGIMWCKNLNNDPTLFVGGNSSEFNYTLSIGLGYTFNTNKTP